MKTPAALLILLLPTSLCGQWECDSLSIASIRYNAFDPSIIEVRTLNSGSWGFNYPSLVVYDGNGDTLAWDPADFFGIGPDQTFLLPLAPGATVPTGPFNATVEVWVGFNDQLACTFQAVADLCPPAPCAEVYPYVIDQSGNGAGLEFDWVVADTNGLVVATGSMVIPAGSTETYDTLCLPPGTYSLGMTNTLGLEANMQFWMRGSEWWNSPTSPHVGIDSGVVSSFVLYEACIPDANAIPEIAASGMELSIVNGILVVRPQEGSVIREVEVMDTAGRLLRAASGSGASLELNIAGLAPGVLVVRASDVEGACGCRTIAWTP